MEGPLSGELVDHKQGVGILPVRGNRIIFVRQFRKAIEKVILEIPAVSG